MISGGVGYRGEKKRERERERERKGKRKREKKGRSTRERGGKYEGRERQSIDYAGRWTIAIVCKWLSTFREKDNPSYWIKERRRKVINTYYELISRSIRNGAKHIHVTPLSRQRALIRPLIMSRLNISLHRCLFSYLRRVCVCVCVCWFPRYAREVRLLSGACNFYVRRRRGSSRCAINSTNLLENLSWPRGHGESGLPYKVATDLE